MNNPDFLETFTQIATAEPDRVFAMFEGEFLSFGRLHAQASALAAYLEPFGCKRAAVMMDNSLEAIAVVFGLALANVTWVPVNTRLVGQGLAYILEHCDPQLVIADSSHLEVIHECGADLRTCKIIDHSVDGSLVQVLQTASPPKSCSTPEVDFALMYTSGTTGPPKGVQVTRRMMDFAGEGVRIASGAEDGDVMFLWEPLCHIGGAQMLILPLLVNVHIAMVPRFSASRFWQDVAETGATHIHHLGGILQMLLKQPAKPDDKDHGVRMAWGGGCPAETWVQFEERFGLPIRECYGMSEASSVTSVNVTGKVGSVGRPLPWLDVRIEKPRADGRGEIVVRETETGALFAGYFRNEDATSRTLVDGALHTGDLGSLDEDGDLWFHGRITDSIRVKGENISAWEIESVAISHPEIEECAAVGVDADVGEQDIKLFVRLSEGSNLQPRELATWLEPRLAVFQMPKMYEVVSNFPRTPSQRIIKGQLT